MEHETAGGAVVADVQPFRHGSDVDALVVKLLNGLQSLSEVPRLAVNPRACGKRTGCIWTTWARTTFYGLLASLRGRLFRDADFAGFYCADNSPFTLEPRYLLYPWALAHSLAVDFSTAARAREGWLAPVAARAGGASCDERRRDRGRYVRSWATTPSGRSSATRFPARVGGARFRSRSVDGSGRLNEVGTRGRAGQRGRLGRKTGDSDDGGLLGRSVVSQPVAT